MKKSILTILVTMFVICAHAQIGIGTTTPNSTLDVRGSIATSYRAFTASTTATATDNLLVFTGSSAATLTLPTAVGCDGRTYMIKNASTTGPVPVLTIATTSAQTIDGAGSKTLTSAYETVTLISNGANWNISATSGPVSSASNDWTQDGNAVASQKSIGTTSNYSLPFITNNTEKMRLTNTGNLGIGITAPSATMHLKAGTATANTAPLKLTAGVNLTTPEDGAIEYNGTHFFGTIGSTRYQLDQQTPANFTGNLSGDVTGTQSATVVGRINGTSLAGLSTGILKNTTATGVPSIAVAADFPILNQNTTGTAANVTGVVAVVNGGTGLTAAATGDILYGSAVNTLSRLSAGTNGQVLTMAGGIPSWATSAASNGWNLTGNTVTAGTHFLGSTNNVSLRVRTNNTERMVVDSMGNVGIGTSTFNIANPEKLVVDAGTTSSVNAIVGKGSIDNYLQLNIQNNSAGTNASSDVVATANNGSETTNYVDMGINGGSNTSGIMGGANDAYLYNIGQNLLVGTGSASKSLVFMTGGTSQSTNERMRIDGSGNVGIGTNSPAYKLQVNAASNPLYLGGVQTGANTDSLVTIINGVVKKLHPSALATSSSNAWGLTGNNNTLASNYFLGTTNTDPLIIKTNSTQVGRFNTNSLALGLGATTNSATQSYAFGSSASVAFGKTNAFAIGNSASTTDNNSFAIGNSAVTNGSNSFAIGNGATANNTNSVAIGSAATTAFSITDALAIGSGATANSSTSVAIGKSATVGFSLSPAIAIGNAANVDGSSGVAIGNGASIGFNSNATAIGTASSASTTANNSTAIGYNAAVTVANTVLLGDKSNSGLSVAIGSENFSASREKLLVDAGTTTSYNVISGKGSIDNYLQLNIQNTSAGTNASSDVVATANNGSETTNYVDMGINGGNYSGGFMGGSNDAYLYNIGQNFLIGAGSASKSLVFMTGGTSQGTNERARIDGTGNFGIGTTSPTQKLDVTGNMRLSGAFMPGNTAGTAGQFLISSGAGVAPTWFDASGYAWLINGNSVPSAKTIGTTNNYELPFITNNTERMRISTTGDVAIGTSTFSSTNPEQLLVNAASPATITDFQNVIVGKGNTNSYAQLNIQNMYSAAGNSASSDVVATSDNGNETTNFIDMGINSGTNTTTGILGGGNTAYLYSTGNNFAIGNSTAAKDIMIFTGGTTVANERMRITGSGNVGIGNTNPNSTLSVTGSLSLNYRSGTGAYTVLATDYVVIHTGGAATWTMPAANTCAGRVYRLLNQGTGNITLSAAVTTANAATTTTLSFLGGTNSMEIISDGTVWRLLK